MCDLQCCSDGLRHIRRWHIQWISVIRIEVLSCTRNRAQLIVQKNDWKTHIPTSMKKNKTNSYIKRLVEHSRTGHIPNCPSGQSASLGAGDFTDAKSHCHPNDMQMVWGNGHPLQSFWIFHGYLMLLATREIRRLSWALQNQLDFKQTMQRIAVDISAFLGHHHDVGLRFQNVSTRSSEPCLL